MPYAQLILIILALFLGSCSQDNHSTELKDNADTAQSKDSVYVFPSAMEMNQRLGHGINLGNALDAPNEGEWGVTLQADYFKWIADSGFATVRIPVRWSAHALEVAPYTIDSVFFSRVQWAVDQAISNKLNVIINMHHYDTIMADPESQQARFLAMWKQIATRFKNYPPQLLFEILNEPKNKLTAAKWDKLLAIAIDSIRAVEPKRTLVVGTAEWGGIAGLNSLHLPADSNLIVTVHYYEPHKFTHQGAAFEEGADVWLGTKWRATPAERSVLDQDIKRIQTWGATNHRPLFMGEFGTYYMVDSTSRDFYTEYITRMLDTLGISWAYWNFSSNFGVYGDTTGLWNSRLMRSLLHPGQNLALDSAMKTGVQVDLSKFVVVDDFDSSAGPAGYTATGIRWSIKNSIPIESSKAGWYTFFSEQSRLQSPAGDTLRHIYAILDSGAKPNFVTCIGDLGYQGKGIHIKSYVKGEDYPYVAFGTAFTGWDSVHYSNFSSLTAVSFRAKGYGQWWMQLLTDSIDNKYAKPDNWGHMGIHFDLTPEWKEYVISIDLLAPRPWSPQASEGLLWSQVRSKVNAIEFMSGQVYGKAVDDSLDIYLDDLHLVGLAPGDLGL